MASLFEIPRSEVHLLDARDWARPVHVAIYLNA
jgi:hypothetical protein